MSSDTNPPDPPPLERPRTESAPHKEWDDAEEARRRSAVAGADYLNQLLGAGLLEVPQVDARPDLLLPSDAGLARAGRRVIIKLALAVTVLLAAVGAWHLAGESRRGAQARKHVETAAARFATTLPDDLKAADAELVSALLIQRDPVVIAALARTRSIAYIAYGVGELNEVEKAVSATLPLLGRKPQGTPGRRDLSVALIARGLGLLGRVEDSAQVLRELRAELGAALLAAPEDGVLRWLEGTVHLATGQREAARSSFERSHAAGFILAGVALADLLADDGRLDEAFAGYEAVNERAKGHPMALIGRALIRLERSADAEATIADLNVALVSVSGRRVQAWKHLALAIHHAVHATDAARDYERSDEELEAALTTGLTEPRFLLRVALARVDRGAIGDAEKMRRRIRFYGDQPAREPLLALLDGELYVANGIPAEALTAVAQADSQVPRVHRVLGRALLDLGRARDALVPLAAALVLAPDDAVTAAFLQQARITAEVGAPAALEALRALSVRSASGLARQLLGEVDLAAGRVAAAKKQFTTALEETDAPLAPRARARLAEFELAAGNLAEADRHVNLALALAPLHVRGHAMKGRVLLAQGKPQEAVAELEAVAGTGVAEARDELALAEALVGAGRGSEAAAWLAKARAHGASKADVARVAGLADAN
ncbi:MAG: hypothetical protein EXR73_06840 [Myxococcales bacterium]|nr:hypothetical protein [Myxococcales bacterium]